MQVTLVLALLFALAVAAFAVQNAEPMTVRFLQWEARTSQVVVILGAAALGALAAGLAGLFRQLRQGMRFRSLQQQVDRLEKEAAGLREDRDRLQTEVERLRRQLGEGSRQAVAGVAPRTEAQGAPGVAGGGEAAGGTAHEPYGS